MVADFYDHPHLYDALLPVGAEVPFYVDLARQQAGAVLELACGTGPITVPGAALSRPTVGLDRSHAMLNVARTRASAAGSAAAFVQGDMRDFALNLRFKLIFVARNSPDKPDAWIVPLALRSIFPQELPMLISAAGLELVSRFGELSRAPFDRGSRVQVCLCRPRP